MYRQENKSSNLCAQIGALLTLFNLVVTAAFFIAGGSVYLFVYTASIAVASLIISICGHANAKKTGKGKALSVAGIVLNVIILVVFAVLFTLFLLFMASDASN